MRSIAEYALTNKALIKLFIAFLVIGGLWSFYSMSKMEDPEITVKQALVMTVYPGADAHQVEFEVSDKLEKAIRQMGDIDYIESKSMNDLSLIKVVLKTTVPNDGNGPKMGYIEKKDSRCSCFVAERFFSASCVGRFQFRVRYVLYGNGGWILRQ